MDKTQYKKAQVESMVLREKSKTALFEAVGDFLNRTVEIRIKTVLLFLLLFYGLAYVAMNFNILSHEIVLAMTGAYITVLLIISSDILNKII
jgi:hypothetical protein